jgi:hypothetical protein
MNSAKFWESVDKLAQKKIYQILTSNIPLPESNTSYPYTQLVSQAQTIERLEKETTAKSDTIALLRIKCEDLETSAPPNQLLQDQLTTKQKQI